MAFGDLARQDDYSVDPLTGVPFAPAPEAQSKFGRIADAIVGGLRNWVETPGRALRGETTPEDAYQWGPATAFGMIAGSKLPGGAAGSGMTKLPGIKAYHGSPHDFDKFDLSKIGTGEGAQAYGHGLYFAENEGVARGYRDALSKQVMTPQTWADDILKHHGGDRAAAIDDLAIRAKSDPSWRKVKDILERGDHVGGRMYEVNLNARPDQFLDWDRPLASSKIQDAVAGHAERVLRETDYGGLRNEAKDAIVALRGGSMTGEGAYDRLALLNANIKPAPGGRFIEPNKIAATEALREAGISGIRYLDQGSRVMGDAAKIVEKYGSREKALEVAQDRLSKAHFTDRKYWQNVVDQMGKSETSNYVVFDPGIIDILRKYGLAGATAAPFGALAAQDNYRP